MSDLPDTVGFYARIGTGGPAVLSAETQEPLTDSSPAVGTKVLCHFGWGYTEAVITEVGDKEAKAETKGAWWPMKWVETEEPVCWRADMMLDKRMLEHVVF